MVVIVTGTGPTAAPPGARFNETVDGNAEIVKDSCADTLRGAIQSNKVSGAKQRQAHFRTEEVILFFRGVRETSSPDNLLVVRLQIGVKALR